MVLIPLPKTDCTHHPHYQGAPDNPMAQVTRYGDSHYEVGFTNRANFASAPHEMAHIILDQIREYALRPDAGARTRREYGRTGKWLGAEYGAPWTRAQQEKFAKALEKYIWEGKPPVPGLAGAFHAASEHMRRLYTEADMAGVELSPQGRAILDRLNSVRPGEAGRLYRNAIADLVERDWAQEFAQTPREARQGVEHAGASGYHSGIRL